MLALVVVTFVDLFCTVFYVLLLARVLMSYIVAPTNQFYEWLVNSTEPLLAPLRKVIPQTPGVDFTPLVAFLILQVVQLGLHSLFAV
jgi:YggT family protein